MSFLGVVSLPPERSSGGNCQGNFWTVTIQEAVKWTDIFLAEACYDGICRRNFKLCLRMPLLFRHLKTVAVESAGRKHCLLVSATSFSDSKVTVTLPDACSSRVSGRVIEGEYPMPNAE